MFLPFNFYVLFVKYFGVIWLTIREVFQSGKSVKHIKVQLKAQNVCTRLHFIFKAFEWDSGLIQAPRSYFWHPLVKGCLWFSLYSKCNGNQASFPNTWTKLWIAQTAALPSSLLCLLLRIVSNAAGLVHLCPPPLPLPPSTLKHFKVKIVRSAQRVIINFKYEDLLSIQRFLFEDKRKIWENIWVVHVSRVYIQRGWRGEGKHSRDPHCRKGSVNGFGALWSRLLTEAESL